MPDKSTRTRIGDRLGYYDENGQYVTHRALTRKPPVSFQKRVRRAWQIANKPREIIGPVGFHNWKALGLIILIGLGTVFLADQALRITIGVSPIPIVDPNQFVWQDDLASASLSGWNQRLASYATDGGLKNIRLTPNSTASAFAISKQSFELSQAVSKVLEVWERWRFQDATGCCPGRWGWYLTRNETAPIEQLLYFPYDDPNVVLFALTTPVSAGNHRQDVFIQRNPIDAVSVGDYGSCETGGTCMFSLTVGLTLDTTTYKSNVLALNFTGNPGSSNYQSRLCWGDAPVTCSGANLATVKLFPWLAIQGQPYHLGIWADEDSKPIEYVSSNTAACTPEETPGNECSMSVGLATPGTAGPVAPPQFMEPGGFFGPLIKALISIGIYVLQAIAQFLGWVADAFITAMDAVGGFFGLGAIGTAIRDALVGVGTWVSNVFGTIFAQAINIATAISNTLSALVQVTGTYWTQLTSWLSAISNLLSLFWPFIAFFGVGLPFSALMTYWLIQGIIMSYNSRDGAFQWMRWTWILSATIFNVAWAIGERAFDVILNVKRLLAQWL